MNSSNSTDYQKFAASPTPKPVPSMPATGIPPVSSTGQYYSSDHHESQMPAHQAQPKTQVPWSSGLFDCFSDVKNCCITCWCPCITFGQIAEIVDKGSSSCVLSGALYTLITFVTGCPCLYSCFYRSKMREQYMLKDNPCGDCLVHCCCESCALCQEYRELQSRGYDMSIGWHGNVEKRNREVGMTAIAPVAPVVEEGMTR